MKRMIIGCLSDGCATREMTLWTAVWLNIILFIYVMTSHRPSTFSNHLVYDMAKSMWTCTFCVFCVLLLWGCFSCFWGVFSMATAWEKPFSVLQNDHGNCFVLFLSLVWNLTGLHRALTSTHLTLLEGILTACEPCPTSEPSLTKKGGWKSCH